MIAVTVGCIDLVRLGIEFQIGHHAELAQIRTAGRRRATAEFFDELSIGGEFQHHAVALAVAAQPDKAFVIDKNGVLLQRPIVALIVAGPAQDFTILPA